MNQRLKRIFDALGRSERILLKLATDEDVEKYLTAHLGEYSDYARVYTETYLTLVTGFEARTGEVPDLVRRIAEVWAEGLAELVENQTDMR